MKKGAERTVDRAAEIVDTMQALIYSYSTFRNNVPSNFN